MALTIAVHGGDDSTRPRLTFDLPRIVLGRGEGSDVRLPDPSVSHRHATLRQRGHDYILVDEGSSNGTFVGRVRLPPQAPRVVRNGQRIRLGRVWLDVEISHLPATPMKASETREVALGLVARALAADGESRLPRVLLRSADGLEDELVLRKDGFANIVGRSPNAELVLQDADSSRRHLEVLREGGVVRVRDLGSKNGSLLDGTPLPSDHRTVWRAGQVIEIGTDVLLLDDPIVAALAELESAADEVLDVDDVPPEPVDEGDDAALDDDAPDDDGDGDDDAPAAGDLDDLVAPSSDADASVPPSAAAFAGPSGAAPMAVVPRRSRPPPEVATPRQWTTTDLLVAFIAVVVLGASVAGMAWLFG